MEVRKERRSRKWPYWYYGMIVLTACSAAAGAYFRGDKVQTDVQSDRIVMGLLVTALGGLAALAFREIRNEIRNIGKRVGTLTDALFQMEVRLHPEHAPLILETFQKIVRSRQNGEFKEL